VLKSYNSSFALVEGPLISYRRRKLWIIALRRFATPVIAVFLTLATFGLLVFIGWRVPIWLDLIRSIGDVKDRLAFENEVLKDLVQIVGGAFLIAGLYFTWKNFVLAREGQITDRFNKAIDHLGDEKLEIRLGGIYALARIANDSERDHWSVVEVLCAFVRSRAKSFAGAHPVVPTDVQAALTVLGERTVEFETDEQCLDLTRVDLRGADFRGAFLERAHFGDSLLDLADFFRASLRGADFRGASLQGTHLREAHLEEANFTGANLQNASLRLATLRKTTLTGARLDATTLIGANLSGALYATRDQIGAAITDETTVLPEFLDFSNPDSQ